MYIVMWLLYGISITLPLLLLCFVWHCELRAASQHNRPQTPGLPMARCGGVLLSTFTVD